MKLSIGPLLENLPAWIATIALLFFDQWAISASTELDNDIINLTAPENSRIIRTNSLNKKASTKPSVELKISRFVNTTFVESLDHAEVLGTAAAYKLDAREPLIGCSVSEFTCTNSRCIPLSKFCDRNNDCEDNSDEPRYCTRK